MECSWDAQLLRLGPDRLPPELLDVVANTHSPSTEYLEAIIHAAQDARYTDLVFAHCERISAHICASCDLPVLGRITPFAPYLEPYAVRVLESGLSPPPQEPDDLVQHLLALLRLLRNNPRTFRPLVKIAEMQSLLSSPSRPVLYLAIRILQILLEGADYWFEGMIKRYLGEDTPEGHINGPWDDRTIDYRFLSLWELQRHDDVSKLLEETRTASADTESGRILPEEAFDQSTALVGGFLLPKTYHSQPANDLVQTTTTNANLRRIAEGLRSSQPLLLSGLAGSGKSLLLRHVAQSLGKLDKMVTLHLNEQSDAKLLVGIYTTGDTPGSFVWQPGVLTTAVREGRWIMIEDLDRAPQEIIGTLLPLIENRELLIPSQKQTIPAAQGFQILATVRSNHNHRGEETRPLTHLLGARHWQSISIAMPTIEEQKQIARQLFPELSDLLPQFLAVYERLQASRQRAVLVGQSKTGVLRSISPRDLLKWCQRVSRLSHQRKSFSSTDVDDIFMEAVDCFFGALPDGPARNGMAAVIAEELRIDPQRRDYLMNDRDVRYEVDKVRIAVGRYSLPRASQQQKAAPTSFSTNPHTSRMLERVAAAVVNREPLLLVGETGVGKTTAVQHLARHLGKKLEPFNLSQQSEAGDLLGGFKPVTPRSLIVPMKDEFDELFRSSFSLTKNQQFLELLGKQMIKSNWTGVCKLWQQALKMVDQQRPASPSRQGEAPNKKRRIESKKTPDFARWDAFATKVQDVERRVSAGGNEGFAFSFIEGNIVKAVRNGDWVLLDEINLASPDTLESIADLLDPVAPSLLLTEAGEIERIEAHPEFRVFAAMNPATDVGKKDLPPGIRSRFTELYVESPDKDFKSLQSVVRSYLRNEATSDAAIAAEISTLYQKIVGLAEENRLVDGAGQKPHFSLRTLTRTLSFAKYIAPQCNIRRALYEGFQMSFLTFLDAESMRLVQPLLEQYLLSKRMNVRAELKKPLRKREDGQVHVQGWPGSKHWVRRGREELQDQPHYILTPFIQSNLENLVRASSTRQFPVLIQGPTSSGKTSMIEYLAKRTGHKFVRINNHEHTDLQEYLGTYVSGTDGRLQFQEGILVKALREGHWIVLDELNLAPTDVLEALNRLLDDNRELLIPETQETVRPHEDFMLFATQNPAGLYGGRKTLSRAFRNRFLELHFDDIPVDELQDILHRRTQLPESRCKRIVTVYRELSVLRQENRLFEQKSFATLRDLFRWALRPNDTIEQLAANGFMLLGERVRKLEERQALKDVIEKTMSRSGPRVTIDETELYSEGSPEVKAYAANVAKADVVWTKAMRRLYVLVSRAIQNNEPVLLVGETGCGKTTVCQMLAEALAKNLHTVNAHQNTETGDLIGSQRPVRNRAAIESILRQRLVTSPALRALDTAAAHSTDALLDAYDQAVASLDTSQKHAYCTSQEHIDIQGSRTRYRALFEWVDGSLVQAMKEGAFFLLDEISLADDSVLERINSVLESQRSIMLAEKGSLDAFVTATPGFQFFATMNPGGDYGKRELSPALRNRFTEIWVPALSDSEDIVQIVSSKLVAPARHYATAIVSFAQWFKARFNTSATTSISVRDALAWVQFVNAFAHVDVTAAVVHGAALVYVDTLGANPAGLMTMTGRSLQQERAECLAELRRVVKADAGKIYSAPAKIAKDSTHLHVGPFSIPNRGDGTDLPAKFTFDAETTRNNAMRVVRAMQLVKPVMLEGSPGVGKTALVTAIASAGTVPLTRINLSEQTDLLDLFGSDAPVEGAGTGAFAWRDAPFLRAMKKGEWVLLDEMNLASQSVLEGLNACLDHRGEVYVPELGQAFSKHPDFRLFAAQNPHHQGGGRKGLPASFVNRFTVVYADAFGPDDLMLICRRSFPDVEPNVLRQAISFVDRLDEEIIQQRRFGANGGPWEFNLRDISRWLALMSSDQGLLKAGNVRDFVDLLFMQRFRSASDRTFVANLFERVFIEAPPPADLFTNVSTLTLQIGLALLPRQAIKGSSVQNVPSSVPAPSHVRVVGSAMICIQQRWPIILSGPSGSGKTSLIHSMAGLSGATVTTISMNAETDAMDLVGGYEQADPLRQGLQALNALKERLAFMAKTELLHNEGSAAAALLAGLPRDSLPAVETLQQIAAAMQAASILEVDDLLRMLQECSTAIDKARFEWSDGLLVEALQEGKWLVLDNANLCSPSVLDRLNSLLEPGGALIINEHTDEDGSPRIIQPHPDFRIFLLTDPRYGELSQAMRNRAVELYLPVPEAGSKILPLHAESIMARFAHLCSLDGSNDDSVSAIATEHMGLIDHPLFPRLRAQLGEGLRGAQHLSEDSVTPTKALSRFYADSASRAQASADYASVQTFHPLNNQALVEQSQQTRAEASTLALSHDVSAQFTPLLQHISALETNQGVVRQLERVERSRLGKRSAKGNSLLVRVRNIVSVLLQFLSTLTPTLELSAVKRFVRHAAACLSYLVQHASKQQLDAALFSGWLSVFEDSKNRASNDPALDSLAKKLSDVLATPETGQAVTIGQACTPMWEALRPQVPRTMTHLHALLRLEQLVERFDALTAKFAQPLSVLVDLRVAFTNALGAAANGADNVDELTERLDSLMPANTESEPEGRAVVTPHFAEVFETMYRRFSADTTAASRLPAGEVALLGVLAMRDSMSDHAFSERADQGTGASLRGLSAILPGVEKFQEANPVSKIASPFFKHYRSASGVALGRLDLLTAESRTLAGTLCQKADVLSKDILTSMDSSLGQIFAGVLDALESANASPDLQHIASSLKAAVNINGGMQPLPDPSLPDGLGKLSSTHSSIYRRLHAVAAYLRRSDDGGANRFQSAAYAWASFAVACLGLYIPDEPFDPALKPRLLRDVHRLSLGHLEKQIQAVQTFRRQVYGADEALCVRILLQDKHELGPEPAVEEICRPEVSELTQLHNELHSLVRAVPQVQRYDVALDTMSMENVLQVRRRLASQYRAYTDITGPVIGFVDCLRVSHEMKAIAGLEAQDSTAELALARATPFVGAGIADWLSDDSFVAMLGSRLDQQQALHVLEALGIRCAFEPLERTAPSLQQAVEDSLGRFYQHWKIKLGEDQRKEAAKSSLYRFKGDEDLNEKESDEHIEALFPTSGAALASSSQEDPQQHALTQELSQAHHALFAKEPRQNGHHHLLQRFTQVASNTSLARDDANYIPAMIAALSNQNMELETSRRSNDLYNIYIDQNVEEARRLAALLTKVKAQFQRLHTAWPEHATPLDVFNICGQILEAAHSDPLTKFLPPLEKLHATVTEWQKVASREYSASESLEELTSLIISWRQLELSSWAGLLHRETVQCEQYATSWWHIAYENIILASNGVQYSAPALKQHTQTLLQVLEGFMASCGLGEFMPRLRMLRDFVAHLDVLAVQTPMLSMIRDALANFVAYHVHFEASIGERLAKGRGDLERDIKNVIQVASWKDRNIEILKQSAKSSHKKLLRIVRKYRNLLAQPVAPILQGGVPQVHEAPLSQITPLLGNFGSSLTYTKALAQIATWSSRPERFKNVGATVNLMREKATRSRGNSSPAERVTAFVEEVRAAITELQKATPSTLTEENKKTVQYLKSRKRRLLADVLRDARAMGFQSNLSDDVLRQQASTHLVLADTPALTTPSTLVRTATADHSLHRLLAIMPSVREGARKHSEDLTPAESARALSLLESMLQLSIKQRTDLCEHLSSAAALERTLQMLTAFAVCSEPQRNSSDFVNQSVARITYLAAAVETTSLLIQAQGKLSGMDYDGIVQELRSQSEVLAKILNTAQGSPVLPAGITSETTATVQAELDNVTTSLQSFVTAALAKHPELEPVLCHLPRWYDRSLEGNEQETAITNGHAPIEISEWIQTTLKVFDQMLGAVQELGRSVVTSESDNEKQAWLVDHSRQLASNLSVLRLATLLRDMVRLLGQIPYVSGGSNATLPVIAAAFQQLHPILEEFRAVYYGSMRQFGELNIETNKMAFQLASSFLILCQEGFCTPSEKTEGEKDNAGDVEAGTGLGEGEGAEDISKDVGDDEDLGDLAQEQGETKEGDEIEDQQDAVDMADQEMEGQTGDGPKGEEETGDGDANDEADEEGEVDEEAGEVDDLGPATVDEKMWDEGQNDEPAEKDTDEAKGTGDNQETAAGKEKKGDEDKGVEAEGAKQEEGSPDEEQPTDEAEAVDQQKPEGMDQHVDDQQNLDLPEDINMDGEKADQVSDNESFGDLEETEEQGVDDEGDQQPEEADSEMQEEIRDGADAGAEEEVAQEQDEAGEDHENTPDDAQSDVLMRDEDDAGKEPRRDDTVAGESGNGADQDTAEQAQTNASASVEQNSEMEESQGQPTQPDAGTGGKQQGTRTEDAQAGAEQSDEQQSNTPYKQMGDVLQEWYKQNRPIEQARQQENDEPSQQPDINMADATFEHLPDEQAAADTQALGAANAEQSTALDEEQGLPVNDELDANTAAFDETEEVKGDGESAKEDQEQIEPSDALEVQERANAFVGDPRATDADVDMADEEVAPDEDHVDDVDQQLTNTHLDQQAVDPESITVEEARSLWSEHEASTRNLALVLTEHLRLILQPTQATKMRGDFRTGKRLNIKRIIPYIASSYKRDKIWMRRSVPSKRSYQIMLAIDDSKSMAESESKGLAFETLALVAKAMSMLEVGELSVVSFGEDVKIAHDFGTPFTSETGADVFKHFTFAQRKTNVRRLLAESIEHFREARLKAAGSASELWQLQLIISDGVCEDHPAIRQLVRQAHEERIMVVFVVVDAAMQQAQASDGSKQSILDLQTAEFVKTASGEMEVKMLKYLDTFPFSYYLIVRDVQELPGVLAGALRQWFAEVVESG